MPTIAGVMPLVRRESGCEIAVVNNDSTASLTIDKSLPYEEVVGYQLTMDLEAIREVGEKEDLVPRRNCLPRFYFPQEELTAHPSTYSEQKKAAVILRLKSDG
jgi:hypothetical protein